MKRLFTIKGRITLLLGSFFLLVIISVGVMLRSVKTQESDALIINMAGRQRMLSQKLTWLSLTDPDNPEFHNAFTLFSQTLEALRYGGETIDSSGSVVILPEAPDQELIVQLDQVLLTWEDFQVYLLSPDAANLSIESSRILDQLDGVVSSFETRAVIKNQRLEYIQVVFLASAILLLGWGFLLTRRKILNPLSVLDTAVQEMTAGNLDWDIPPIEQNELGDLASAFDIMRTELASSRDLLETEVAQRTRELVAAFELSQEIVAKREQTELIDSVVERARVLMGAESAALCLITPDGKELEMLANSGNTSISPGLSKIIEADLIVSVVGEGKTIGEKTGCADCAFLDEKKAGQCVVTPLRAMDRTIGALCVVRSKNEEEIGSKPFDSEGQRALALLANSVAVAITNTRLAKLEHHKVKQEAALAEREQIAANLHDDLAQTLSFTRLKLEQLEEDLADSPNLKDQTDINQITSAIDSAYHQVRYTLTGLLRPVPADEDLFRNLSAIVADFEQESHCQAELCINDPAALEIPPDTQIQVLHVVREALSNVKQHAQATQVRVHVDKLNGGSRYTIEDNGIGFDPHSPVGNNHFGLQIMQTRIERSGGIFQVVSGSQKGTKAIMTFPIKLDEDTSGER
ncbi:MAG TPA: HAMP domain-containing protein [Chloroflexi bacterium]|nr:HAMP domain-containing protein [Chloroflexota bacterium]